MDFQLKMRKGSKDKKPLHIQYIFQVMRKKPATFCLGMHANGEPKEMRNQRHIALIAFKQTVAWDTWDMSFYVSVMVYIYIYIMT